MTSKLYPTNLLLRDKRVLLVGAGVVAERKLKELLASGAKVFVVSKEVSPGFLKLAEKHRLEINQRQYQREDMQGVWLVIAATNDQTLQRQLASQAEKLKIFINVVDQPELCSFQLPARAERGKILLTASTSGQAPAASRLIRTIWQKEFLPEIVPFVKFIASIRKQLKKNLKKDALKRQMILRKLNTIEIYRAFLATDKKKFTNLVAKILPQSLAKEYLAKWKK